MDGLKCSECNISYNYKDIYDYCTGTKHNSNERCNYIVCGECYPKSSWIKQACGICDHNACSNCDKLCKECKRFHCSDCNYHLMTHEYYDYDEHNNPIVIKECENSMHPISWWKSKS